MTEHYYFKVVVFIIKHSACVFPRSEAFNIMSNTDC